MSSQSKEAHKLYMRKWRAERRTSKVRALQREEATGIDMPLQQLPTTLDIKGPAHGLTIAVIPDAQVKPGVPIDHLRAAGNYIAAHRPDVIVCIGDFADMASLSSYDVGTRGFEGRRYTKDIDAAKCGMDELMGPLTRSAHPTPKLIMTLGNHEDRITRATNTDAKLDGLMQVSDLSYEQWGWAVYPFLQPVVINGVAFCHYFPGGVMGRPITSPKQILNKLHMSAFAGHQQGRDIAFARRADGRELTAIISGSFYQHEEGYLSPFTNQHWRGMYYLHEVRDGGYDAMELSLGYLLRKWK